MAVSVSNGTLPLSASESSSVAHEAYRPDIDGLRAIAALAVVGHHLGVLPGGFVGVDIFFVISGYLISGLILRALARGSFSGLEFYAKRVKRIFPALVVFLLTASVLGWLMSLSVEYRRLGREIAEGAGFVYNLTEHWHDDPDFHAYPYRIELSHLWSLGVEEQFYLFWPLFLMLIWKLKGRQLALLAGVTAISFAINVVEVSQGVYNYYLPEARLWQLSLGGSFAYMQACGPADLERLRSFFSSRALSWLGLHHDHIRGLIGAALLVSSCAVLENVAFPGWKALTPTLGSLFVISAGTRSWFNRYVLSTTPLVMIGLISYPIYLWHYLLLQIPHLTSPEVTPIMTAAALLGTFILSFITYKYIETPLRRSTNTMVIARTLCVVMLASGIVGYVMFVGGIPARPVPLDAKKFILASSKDWLPGTHDTSWTQGSDQLITLGSGLRHVLYIGDSNIQQYYPRIEKVLADHPLNSRGAIFAARDWCAPIESDIPGTLGATSPVCRAFAHKAFEYAKGPGVDTVVIGACWRCYFLSFDDPLGHSGTINTNIDHALSELRQEIERLVFTGKRVYLILGMPVGVDLDPRFMIKPIIMPPGFRVVISSPNRSDLSAAVDPIRSRLLKIAHVTGASVIDPMKSLCDDRTCSPLSADGEPIYHDWFNLSPSYVRESVRFLDRTVLDVEAVDGMRWP